MKLLLKLAAPSLLLFEGRTIAMVANPSPFKISCESNPHFDRGEYVEMCRHDFLTEPGIFISLIEVADGPPVTMTGQGFQMIAAQKSTSAEARRLDDLV